MTDVDELAREMREACLTVQAAAEPVPYMNGEHEPASKRLEEATRAYKVLSVLTDRDALKARVEKYERVLNDIANRKWLGFLANDEMRDAARAVLTHKEPENVG